MQERCGCCPCSRAHPRRISRAEALEQPRSRRGVGDFGMELHAVVAAALVAHGGERNGAGAGGGGESRRQRIDPVAVTHPDIEHAVTGGGRRGRRSTSAMRADKFLSRQTRYAAVLCTITFWRAACDRAHRRDCCLCWPLASACSPADLPGHTPVPGTSRTS